MASQSRNYDNRDSNPDPITGAPGAHPVGTGVGAAGGGAAGVAVGSMAGPVGTAVGAVVGAVAGGLAGKGVAEQIDPTAEDAYWRENYRSRPYASNAKDYSELAPAYRYGWESRQHFAGKSFDQAETDMRRNWASARGQSKMDWDQARFAARDAWDRIDTRGSGSTANMKGEQSTAIPVVEEELRVGKRQVQGSGVRVESKVIEKPVEAQVTLREEHARVERRPVDRPATDKDIRTAVNAEMEVRDSREEAVVDKQARVVEEVHLGKEATERTEKVQDTVRRTDVEVQKIDKTTDTTTNRTSDKNKSR